MNHLLYSYSAYLRLFLEISNPPPDGGGLTLKVDKNYSPISLSISAMPSTTDAKTPRGRRTLIMNLRRSLTITFISNFHPFFILVTLLYNIKITKSIGFRKIFKIL